MILINARTTLFKNKYPYEDSPKTKALFLEAIKENCLFHDEHCEDYRKILQHFTFHLTSLTTQSCIGDIPVLPTLMFKKHRLFSLSELRILI